MSKREKAHYLVAAICAVLFAVLILCVKLVDVRSIGPLGSSVGLAACNAAARDLIGAHAIWYTVTEVIGVLALASAAGFAGLGLYQWISRKSLKGVDIGLYLLAGCYALVLIAYLLFEVAIINYRPVLTEGALEASFPSSHTMLVLCVFGAAIPQLVRYIRSRACRVAAVAVCAMLMGLTVIGRTLSGVHWLTDILGGVLLSGVILGVYGGLMTRLRPDLPTSTNESS